MDRVISEASHVSATYRTDDLDTVAKKLGVSVYDILEAPNLKEAYFPELRSIALRSGLPGYERRYLIAHALGHDLLHRQGKARDYLKFHVTGWDEPYNGTRNEISKLEAEADLFAAYLLVPDDKLGPVLGQAWVWESTDPVMQLALEFGIPPEPMRVRMVYERCRRLRHQS